jgi:hypothetical protein
LALNAASNPTAKSLMPNWACQNPRLVAMAMMEPSRAQDRVGGHHRRPSVETFQ